MIFARRTTSCQRAACFVQIAVKCRWEVCPEIGSLPARTTTNVRYSIFHDYLQVFNELFLLAANKLALFAGHKAAAEY
jgi:hypothetical protein